MRVVGALLIVMALAGPAVADLRSKAAQEAAEFILQRFGRSAVREGVETLARKIETYTAKHGDAFLKAVRQCGPRTFHLVEEAGAHSNQVVRCLAEHGERGATWVVTRPKGMQLFLKHGEEAASALVRHPGVAEPVIEKLGQPAVRAFQAVGSQGGRRLAMMAEGDLAKIGRNEELLEVIAKYGDKGMTFVWEHKGSLAITAVLATFLANPEPYIAGAKELTQTAVKPVAEVPSIIAKEATAEMAKGTNWTWILSLGVLAAVGLAIFRRVIKKVI